MIKFTPWPKIARLNRDIVITEKIDGTNGAIGIVDMSAPDGSDTHFEDVKHMRTDAGIGWPYAVYAQSRSRIITPDADNFGFARWVWDNAEDLVTTLGPGLHFGEWWGSGIQRGYDLPKGEKRFSLFNTGRWESEQVMLRSLVPGLDVVPVLYEGSFDFEHDVKPPWKRCLSDLRFFGSIASSGFMRPEGIVIYHKAANEMFKVTLENDEEPKGLVTTSNRRQK